MKQITEPGPHHLTGEDIYLKEPFEVLCREHAVDMIQPDLATAGGILETQKIGDMAQEYGVPMVLHMAGSPIACMASVHCAAATENFLVLENHSVDDAGWADIVEGIEKPVINKGYITLPNGPGLGITLNEEALKSRVRGGYFLRPRSGTSHNESTIVIGARTAGAKGLLPTRRSPKRIHAATLTASSLRSTRIHLGGAPGGPAPRLGRGEAASPSAPPPSDSGFRTIVDSRESRRAPGRSAPPSLLGRAVAAIASRRTPNRRREQQTKNDDTEQSLHCQPPFRPNWTRSLNEHLFCQTRNR